MQISNSRHNYGIDLLRTIAMLMIVAHHFSLHGGIVQEPSSAQGILNALLALHGKTGVNIFVLITGFFAGQQIRREKIVRLIFQTTFYSLLLTIIACITGITAFSKKALLKAAVPLLFGNNYWFITTYLELYLLQPILNKIIELLTEKTYRQYLLGGTLLLCVFPTVIARFIEINDFGYNALVWFVYLYFFGAYLSKYGLPIKRGTCKYIWISLMTLQIITCILIHLEVFTGITYKVLECIADYSANAVFPLSIAVTMFLSFQSLLIPKGRNLLFLVGSSTLGIYLFHDNNNFRGWMWQEVYQVASGRGTAPFAVSAVLSILIVFLIGCLIELLRMNVIKALQRPSKT